MLDVHRLRVFRSVVASGSIQAAASNLGYTPSAVSQHVTALQRETGSGADLAGGPGDRADRRRSGPGRSRSTACCPGWARSSRWSATCAPVGPAHCRSPTSRRSARPGCRQWCATMMTEFPDVRLDLALREDVPTDPAERPDVQIAVEQGAIHRPGLVAQHLLDDPYVAVLPAGHPLADAARDRPRGPGRRPLGRQRLRPGLVPTQPDRGLPRGRFQPAVPRRGARLPDRDGVRGGRDRGDRAARAGRPAAAARGARGAGGRVRPRSARSTRWSAKEWPTPRPYGPCCAC